MEVKSHSKADFVEPEVQKNANTLILDCETNDITNGFKTYKKMKKLVKEIAEIGGKIFTSTAIL